jgi:AraC family transcriptional regulator of arabinose operon
MPRPAQSKNYDGTLKEWEDRHIRSPRALFGQVIYEPGGYCGPRVQQNIEFVILHHGACEVHVDGEPRNLQPGRVYLFLPRHREEFRFAADSRSHHSWFTLSPKLPDATLRRLLTRAPREAAPSALFTKLLADVFLINPIHNAAGERVIEMLALALCSEYLAMSQSAPGTAGADPCVVRALRCMEDHYPQADCLARALAVAGCSRNALAARFVSATTRTPDRYLWQLRTEKGIALLGATGLTVSEIAHRCGFQNPFHFSRLVKSTHGCSPSSVRAQAWDGLGLAEVERPR